MPRLTRLSLALLLSAAACSEHPSSVRPAEDVSLVEAVDVTQALPAMQGFAFLTPLGVAPVVDPSFDSGVAELLAVEVCRLNGSVCRGGLVTRITSQDAPPARLRLGDGDFYVARWLTDQVEPGRYRIHVRAGETLLGVSTVRVIGSGGDGGGTSELEVRQGSTLPIRFRTTFSLGGRVGPQGGSLTVGGGQVHLQLPAGALARDVFITTAAATGLPASPVPLAGTAWDLGPDGLTFAAPVQLELRYDPATLPVGAQESELRIHKLVGGAYQEVPGSTVDTVAKTVSAALTGFSIYVILPSSQTDIEPPKVQKIEFLDPATGIFGNQATLDVSNSDQTLTARVTVTDNLSGVRYVAMNTLGSRSTQQRTLCTSVENFAPPVSGTRTDGVWQCTSTWPQHSEAGPWQPYLVVVQDFTNNAAGYARPLGYCASNGHCLTAIPTVDIVSVPEDVTAPTGTRLQVSLNTQPRMFGQSAVVDASTSSPALVFSLDLADDLSGIPPAAPGVTGSVFIEVAAAGGRIGGSSTCLISSGTPVAATWECLGGLVLHAPPGVYGVTRLTLLDRAGNSVSYTPDASGNLCTPLGQCIPNVTITVVSPGDTQPPQLQSVAITVAGSTLTTALQIVDNSSGVVGAAVRYRSVLVPQQSQACSAVLTGGTALDGTWACSFVLPPTSVRGAWELYGVDIRDLTGNTRTYTRRASDGFLCYTDPTAGTVCQDFGTTDLILQ